MIKFNDFIIFINLKSIWMDYYRNPSSIFQPQTLWSQLIFSKSHLWIKSFEQKIVGH